MDINIKEIKEELQNYFGSSIPEPKNYPDSFLYYLELYNYLKRKKYD
jgi:hypothetical protein